MHNNSRNNSNSNSNNNNTTTPVAVKLRKAKPEDAGNRYEPIGIVGRGSYGTVMKCKDNRTDEIVAVKKITDSYVQTPEVLREITVLGRLDKHAHVVGLLDVFRKKAFFYIVFPYFEYNMYQYMNEFYPGGFGDDLTKEFMIQVIRGIDHIHENHVVHRDIKPENILVSGDGVVKICDLGISRMVCPRTFNAKLLLTPEMGTLWYQAPEVLLGIQNYSTEIDIWSLGIVFIECTIGYPIITRRTAMKQYKSIVKRFGISIRDQKYMNRKLKEINSVFSMNYIATGGFANTIEALKSHYPLWPHKLIEIISKCLQFNPSKRKTTKSLLAESYFVDGNFLKIFTNKLKKKLM